MVTEIPATTLAVNQSAASEKLSAHIYQQTGSHMSVVPIIGNAVLADSAMNDNKKDMFSLDTTSSGWLCITYQVHLFNLTDFRI